MKVGPYALLDAFTLQAKSPFVRITGLLRSHRLGIPVAFDHEYQTRLRFPKSLLPVSSVRIISKRDVSRGSKFDVVVGSIALPSFPHYYLQTLAARVEVFLPTSSEHSNTFRSCVSLLFIIADTDI
jgi:hypothetical protein